MAGMLPGVEAARRRRIHHNGGLPFSGSPSIGLSSSPSSRRPSASLFSTTSSASSNSSQRSRAYQVDEKLGQLARKAKERLDERLKAQRKSELRRNNSDLDQRTVLNRGSAVQLRELRTEVYGSKKKLMMSWGKLGWRTWEQQECAVCLEEYKVGENLVNLPCAHRFHSRCLVPWLETNAHCPCCRTSILSN